MQVGLLEFNHNVLLPASAAPFFSFDYDEATARAERRWTDGGTDIQSALRAILAQYADGGTSGSRASSHALLLTDGAATMGSSMWSAEGRAARTLGVCIHTVYIGASKDEAYPEGLTSLARATGGIAFQAVIQHGTLELLDRTQITM